jgi:GTP diphosphokinase / guanosine-3',5'-bis(diphosphate) 3'-diphosphatase
MHNANSVTSLILTATAFAAEKHRHQRRKDAQASPYINHPIALARVLSVEAGIDDPEVICAALLHDTIEDTDTTTDELRRVFGDAIARIVDEVTDDKTLESADRKRLQIEHAAHISPKAKLVKLADKICNLRDIYAAPPTEWSVARRREYIDWAAAVVAGLRGTQLRLEAIFDELVARRATIVT